MQQSTFSPHPRTHSLTPDQQNGEMDRPEMRSSPLFQQLAQMPDLRFSLARPVTPIHGFPENRICWESDRRGWLYIQGLPRV